MGAAAVPGAPGHGGGVQWGDGCPSPGRQVHAILILHLLPHLLPNFQAALLPCAMEGVGGAGRSVGGGGAGGWGGGGGQRQECLCPVTLQR